MAMPSKAAGKRAAPPLDVKKTTKTRTASPATAPSAPPATAPSAPPATAPSAPPAFLKKVAEETEEEIPPPSPAEPLETLGLIHQYGRPVESAYMSFIEAIKSVMSEARGKGDRAAHLVQIYSRLRTAEDILGAQVKEFNELLSMFKGKLCPEAFEREGLQTLTTQDGDRMTITQQMFTSVLAEMRDAAKEWLREHGHGDLIVETINAGSLSAFARAEIAEGRELPASIFTSHLAPSASLTRAKSKGAKK
jgi:hypothetical protein